MHVFFILFTIHLIVNAFCRFCPFFLFVESDRDKIRIKSFRYVSATFHSLSKAVLLGVNRNAFRHQ